MVAYSSPTVDEFVHQGGSRRPAAVEVMEYFAQFTGRELLEKQREAERLIHQQGITFTVYTNDENGNLDRPWPLDIIPRVMDSREWTQIEEGLAQRLSALNLFIADLYGEQKCLTDGVVPTSLIENSENFRKQCRGAQLKHGVWAHICGSDLVRDADDQLYVLEDNLRVPSGVSYMLENRRIMKNALPELFSRCSVLPVNDYIDNLWHTLCALSDATDPVLCVLTPGVYNSAYFEHGYLARQLGADLVEGRDLVVGEDECVYVRKVNGLKRVDVIYRRVDDEFLDPECFNPESTLGVRGLMRAWRAGNVAIANAPGAGVADDKAVYSFVPDIIRYFLKQEPMIKNVPTYLCENAEDREYVLANIEKLVVKPVNASGGYGLLIGPQSSAAQCNIVRDEIIADPQKYVAQPVLSISTSPTLVNESIVPRHVDLRPFVLQSDKTRVTAGGLTRVALVEGSLVVNYSQGGGSKDTWIVDSGTFHNSDDPNNQAQSQAVLSPSGDTAGMQSQSQSDRKPL